jgi:hypothetical protein
MMFVKIAFFVDFSYLMVIFLFFFIFRKRDEQLKDELRKASEEKEPLLRRSSAKDEKSPRGRRESSTSSDKIHVEEPMGPSICPDSVFQTLVTLFTKY